jgi:hypothetical protein
MVWIVQLMIKMMMNPKNNSLYFSPTGVMAVGDFYYYPTINLYCYLLQFFCGLSPVTYLKGVCAYKG